MKIYLPLIFSFMENKELLYYPILDRTRPKAQELQQQIENLLYTDIFTDDENKATAYLVWWGDGFMLDTIKKHYDFQKSPEENKLFFWLNCWTLWFILNDMTTLDDLPRSRQDIDIVKAQMMKVEIMKKNGEEEVKYALNDVIIGGNILDYYKFQISAKQLNKKFHGTGVMISTALWSSAYWLNNWWPLMPAGSQLWWVSGLATLPFWHTVLKPEDIHITIAGRTPVVVGVDWYGGKVDDVEQLTIRPTTHYAQLGFFKDISFDSKRMLLVEQKLLKQDF